MHELDEYAREAYPYCEHERMEIHCTSGSEQSERQQITTRLTLVVCNRDGLHPRLPDREPEKLLVRGLDEAYPCAGLNHIDRRRACGRGRRAPDKCEGV